MTDFFLILNYVVTVFKFIFKIKKLWIRYSFYEKGSDGEEYGRLQTLSESGRVKADVDAFRKITPEPSTECPDKGLVGLTGFVNRYQ